MTDDTKFVLYLYNIPTSGGWHLSVGVESTGTTDEDVDVEGVAQRSSDTGGAGVAYVWSMTPSISSTMITIPGFEAPVSGSNGDWNNK